MATRNTHRVRGLKVFTRTTPTKRTSMGVTSSKARKLLKGQNKRGAGAHAGRLGS